MTVLTLILKNGTDDASLFDFKSILHRAKACREACEELISEMWADRSSPPTAQASARA